MVGIAKRDRTQRDPCGSASRSSRNRRGRSVRRYPSRSAGNRHRRSADQLARGHRNRARRYGICTNSGLVVTASPWGTTHRELIVRLATRNKLPSVGPARIFVESGGLLSYGANFEDQFRRSASYVDRILKGEKPADLPVQGPTKYELVVNLKTAKELRLTIPQTVLARADQVIE